MSEPAVAVSGLSKAYEDVPALTSLSFTAARGQVTAVLGRNGAGKTTAIEICEGLRTNDAGTVSVLGLAPDDVSLRSRVGVMPQTGGAYQAAPVLQLAELFAAFYARPLPVQALLERLELWDLRKRLVKRLSGGEAQRLSLALAIIGRPELVFLDEPTANLDVHARNNVWELVRDLRTSGVSVVLTTHNMAEAEALADSVVIIDGGVARAEGAPAELLASSGSAAAVTFNAPTIAGLKLPRGMKAEDLGSGRFRVNGASDSRALAKVSTALADAGIEAAEIRLGGGGLEELFLSLTAGAEQ